MKYIKTYENSRAARWLVNIDKYFEASLRKIGMDREESARWAYNFTHDVSKPKTNKIIVIGRNDHFTWNDVSDVVRGREVKLTPKEKKEYDIESTANKYNI